MTPAPTLAPAVLLCAAAMLFLPSAAPAQWTAPSRFAPSGDPPPPGPGSHPVDPGTGTLDRLRTPGGAFVASLVAPGAGQAALGLRRWVLYAGLEVVFWSAFVEAELDAGRLGKRYRDLAWEVARQPNPTARRDGGWSYYEAMSQWLRSGAFDADPGAAGVQPERDANTYNGTIWSLARSLFLPGGVEDPGAPEYALALRYYEDRAIGADFLWSWAGNPQALERFRHLIDEADGELRTRSRALGLILATHVTAAVDALIAARLRTGADFRLRSRIVPTPGPPQGGGRPAYGLELAIDWTFDP